MTMPNIAALLSEQGGEVEKKKKPKKPLHDYPLEFLPAKPGANEGGEEKGSPLSKSEKKQQQQQQQQKKKEKEEPAPVMLEEASSLLGHWGLDSYRLHSIVALSESLAVALVGNALLYLDLTGHSIEVIPGQKRGGVGAICRHPTKNVYVVCDKSDQGLAPSADQMPAAAIRIHTFPSRSVERTLLSDPPVRGYSVCEFNHAGDILATVAIEPDFTLTLWNWEKGEVVLRNKASGNEVYSVYFSAFHPGKLTTSGLGHIKFWTMAETFTGLKLQGAVGRFGRIDICDVTTFVQLPDNKVLSGSESGYLLLWEGGMIKCQFGRRGIQDLEDCPCHFGSIDVVMLIEDGAYFLTAGSDGYIRYWPFKAIDLTEATGGTDLSTVTCLREVFLGADVSVRAMSLTPSKSYWMISDSRGSIRRIPYESKMTIESTMTGTVNKIAHLKDNERSIGPILDAQHKYFSFASGSLNAIAAHPSKHCSVVGGKDGVLRLIDHLKMMVVYSIKIPEMILSQKELEDEEEESGASSTLKHQLLLHKAEAAAARGGGAGANQENNSFNNNQEQETQSDGLNNTTSSLAIGEGESPVAAGAGAGEGENVVSASAAATAAAGGGGGGGVQEHQKSEERQEEQKQEEEKEQQPPLPEAYFAQTTSVTKIQFLTERIIIVGCTDGSVRTLRLCTDRFEIISQQRPHTAAVVALAVDGSAKQVYSFSTHDKEGATGFYFALSQTAGEEGVLIPYGFCKLPLDKPTCAEWNFEGTCCFVGFKSSEVLALQPPACFGNPEEIENFEFEGAWACVAVRQKKKRPPKQKKGPGAAGGRSSKGKDDDGFGDFDAEDMLSAALKGDGGAQESSSDDDDEDEADVGPWPVNHLARVPPFTTTVTLAEEEDEGTKRARERAAAAGLDDLENSTNPEEGEEGAKKKKKEAEIKTFHHNDHVVMSFNQSELSYEYKTSVRYGNNAIAPPPLPKSKLEPENWVEEPARNFAYRSSTVQKVVFSSSGKLMLSVLDHARICIRPLPRADEKTMLGMTAQLHDGLHGKINDAAVSFDDSLILSVGEDGALFSQLLNNCPRPTSLLDLSAWKPTSSSSSSESTTTTTTTVADETSSPAVLKERDLHQECQEAMDAGRLTYIPLSVQAQKFKDDADKAAEAALSKKERLLKKIHSIHADFAKIVEKNDSEQGGRKLGKEDLTMVDDFVKEKLDQHLLDSIADAKKEFNWVSAKKLALLNKLRAKYIDVLATDHFCVRPFDSSRATVHSFRTPNMTQTQKKHLEAIQQLVASGDSTFASAARNASLFGASLPTSGDGAGAGENNNNNQQDVNESSQRSASTPSGSAAAAGGGGGGDSRNSPSHGSDASGDDQQQQQQQQRKSPVTANAAASAAAGGGGQQQQEEGEQEEALENAAAVQALAAAAAGSSSGDDYNNNNNNNNNTTGGTMVMHENQNNNMMLNTTSNNSNKKHETSSLVQRQLQNAEERRRERDERKQKLHQLINQNPKHLPDDPTVVQAIHRAERKMGDYVLKTSDDFKIPDHLRPTADRKSKQLALLEHVANKIRAVFNTMLLDMRDKKKILCKELNEDRQRIVEVCEKLKIECDIPEFKLDREELPEETYNFEEKMLLDWEAEKIRQAEKKAEMDRKKRGFGSDLAQLDEKKEEKKEHNKEGGGGAEGSEKKEGDGGENADAKETGEKKSHVSATGAASAAAGGGGGARRPGGPGTVLTAKEKFEQDLRNKLETQVSQRRSEVEVEEQLIQRERLFYERARLTRKIQKSVRDFDTDLRDLLRKRLSMESDLLMAEMRSLLLFNEFLKLIAFRLQDEELAERLEQARVEKKELVQRSRVTSERVIAQNGEIEKIQFALEQLKKNFLQILMQAPESAHDYMDRRFFLRINRRKYGDDEDDDEITSEEEEENEADGRYADDGEPDRCPAGVEEDLFQEMLDLRERRLDIEEEHEKLKKVANGFKEEHEELVRRENEADANLSRVERDIEKFQNQKQKELNALDTVVVLKMSQIQCLKMPEKILPDPLDDPSIIVFRRENLQKLVDQIERLDDENKDLESGLDVMQQQKSQFGRKRTKAVATMQEWENKVYEVQLLKFGQRVNLELLENIAVDRESEELKQQLKMEEIFWEREVAKQDDKLLELRQVHQQRIAENTSHLKELGSLRAEQYEIEQDLSTSLDRVVSKMSGGSKVATAADRQRLRDMIVAQQRDIDALKAEVAMLRRKGGYVYTPVVNQVQAQQMSATASSAHGAGGMQQQQQQQNYPQPPASA